MDVLLTVGFLLTVLVTMGSGQSCPPVQNVAKVCSSSTYTGARVLMDTSYYTDSAQNCTCTFSTTANTLRIVTYAAPNYQQCNSAIRLYSSSGNEMRFQCLMSGTYLDTSVHKGGGAEFQTYGPVYDKNYCLVLEHLGTMTDSITISCKKNEDIHKSLNVDVTTSADQTVPTTTTYSDATSTSGMSTDAEISTTTTDSVLTLSNDNIDLNVSNNNIIFNSKENETGQISQVPEFTTSSALKISHFQDTTNEASSEKATISITVGNTVTESSERSDIGTLILKNSPRDIITFDKMVRENKESTTEPSPVTVESNDTANNDMVTVTSDLRRFGSGMTANENQTLLHNFDIAFENDAIRKDNLISNPAFFTTVDPITFGNNIILKDSTNEPAVNEDRGLLLQNGSVHSNDGKKSTSNEQIFGNDAVTSIYTNVQSTVIGTRTFGSDVVENTTVDRNLNNTFGNDESGDARTFNSLAYTTEKMVTLANDATHQRVSTKNTPQEGTHDPSLQNGLVIEETHDKAASGRHNIGSNAFRRHNNPSSTSYPTTFGSDVNFVGNQTFDISFDNVGLRRETVTSTSTDITTDKIAMIKNDTVSNEMPTDKQYTGTKNSNAMSDNPKLITDAITNTDTYIQTTSFGFQTLAPDLVIDDNKTFVKNMSISFGNDGIGIDNNTTPSKDRMSFGNNHIVKDVLNNENNTYESMYLNINNSSNKDSVKRQNGESLVMTSGIRPTVRVDTVHSENHTFGPNISLKERATFGNDAIRPVPTVPGPTTHFRQSFGADAFTKQSFLSTKANRDIATLLLHDIANEKINSSPSLITTNEIQTFGFDVNPTDKAGGFQNEKHNLGSDIASTEQTTFVRDDIPRKISEPTIQTRQSFGADVVTKQTVLSTDNNRDDTNLLPGDITSERSTLYPYISTSNTRQTFDFDAIPKDRVDRFHGEKQTFGPDTAPKEQSTFGSDAMPPLSIVPETTTQTRQSFGTDAVTKQNSLLSNSNKEWANFLPSELTVERSTSNPFADTTNERQTFGLDGIPNERIDRFKGEQHIFGPDIASKERTTFGNDAVRPVSMVSEANTPIRQRFGADAVTIQSSLSVSANKEEENILLGDIAEDKIVNDSLVNTTNSRQTFGFDAIPKETTTYESIVLKKDRTNMVSSGGKEIITTQQPRTTAAVASFWPDVVETNATLMDILKNEALSVADGTKVATKTNITSEILPTKVLFGNDAILKDDELLGTSTRSPYKFWLDSDKVKQIPLETTTPLSTTGSQTLKGFLNSLQSEVLTPEKRATFGNDVILKESLANTSAILTSTKLPFVTTELHAMFGSDVQSNNGAFMEGQRNVTSFSDDTKHSSLALDDRQDLRNDTSAELFEFDGLSILNSTAVTVNSTSNQRSTFGSDAIEKELFTDSPTFNNKSKIDLGKTMVLRETLDSVKDIEKTSALANDGLVELPRISLGNDVLKKEDLLPKSSVIPDLLQIDHVSLLNNLSPSRVHAVLGSTAQTLDVDTTTRDVPLENNVIAERPMVHFSHLNMGVPANFRHDAISGELSTASTSIQSNDQSTREIFGEFKLRRQLLTTTETLNVATTTHDLVGSVANDMGNNNIDTVAINNETVQNNEISVENNAFKTSVSPTNSVIGNDNKFMVSSGFSTTTMQSEVSEPIIDETMSKQRDSSLLSSINEIRPGVPNTLMGSILKTHSDTVSNIDRNILRPLPGNNDDINTSTEISTMRSDVILNDIPSSTDSRPLPGEVLIPRDVVSTPKEDLPVTTDMDRSTMISETAASIEKNVKNIELPIIKVSTVTEKDASVASTTMTNFLETTSSITTDITTSSERPVMKTTKMKSTSTQSTLPAIIPGQQDAFKPTVPVIRRISTDARTSTESTYRTTKKIYRVMVGEPRATDDRNVVDGSSNIRSSKDQLNVSLDDETDRPFFNMNNKTYIIVVIAVAGFIVLVAVISVIICNKRKSHSAKADITNGVTATSISHNNAVYDNDVSDAERGTVPAASNGVDTAKQVEVIEPHANGSDNNLSGNL